MLAVNARVIGQNANDRLTPWQEFDRSRGDTHENWSVWLPRTSEELGGKPDCLVGEAVDRYRKSSGLDYRIALSCRPLATSAATSYSRSVNWFTIACRC